MEQNATTPPGTGALLAINFFSILGGVASFFILSVNASIESSISDQPISMIFIVFLYAIVPVLLLVSITSHVMKSRKIALAGLLVSFVVPAFTLVYVLRILILNYPALF